MDENILTYEQLQGIIDKQLAHIKELHARQGIDETLRTDLEFIGLQKKSMAGTFWESIKAFMPSLFKQH